MINLNNYRELYDKYYLRCKWCYACIEDDNSNCIEEDFEKCFEKDIGNSQFKDCVDIIS